MRIHFIIKILLILYSFGIGINKLFAQDFLIEDNYEYEDSVFIEDEGEDTLAERRGCEKPARSSLTTFSLGYCEDCHFLKFGTGDCPTKNGCSFCTGLAESGDLPIVSRPIFRVVRFNVTFKDNVDYDISGNNWWNKLMQINSRECSRHRYYLSMGWKWNTNSSKIDLGLYSHINHKQDKHTGCYDSNARSGREYVSLGQSVNKNTTIEAELIFYSKGFYVRAGERGVAIRRDFSLEELDENRRTNIRRYGYFGGNPCPDKDVGL